MKKTILYIGIGLLVLIIAFSSCSGDPETTEPTPTIEATQNITASPTATPEPTPEPTPKPTTKPTVKPTAKATASPTQAPQQTAQMVWVTEKSKKYHSHSGCSNMKEPYQISKDNAIKSGRSACSKCY